MRRKSSKLVLISAGAALAWFLDPVSGRDRRRQVADQLAGLTGASTTGGDPTGGAAPAAVTGVQPYPPTGADPVLAQAVEAAAGHEKMVGSPDDVAAGADPADQDRAALRTTW